MPRVEETLASYLSTDAALSLKTLTLKELRRAADLFLRATKETAHAIGCSMAALVAMERHLWLNLLGIGEKDRAFLIDAPPSGLFGDAVNTVI